MIKRFQITYSGTVQGVGFRYAARSFGQKNNLTGWVKNLADGRVQLQAQGPEEAFDAYLDALYGEFKGYIRDRDIEEIPLQDQEEDFRIRF